MTNSHIETKIRQRDGYPGIIDYADIIIDGISLYERIAHDFDFVSCLGWGPGEFQELQIKRLLLGGPSDLPNDRYSIYICPACTDLGCGAITVNIEFTDNTVRWSKLGHQDNISGKIKYFDGISDFIFIRHHYETTIESTRGVGSGIFPWT